tara:strand:- start:273 stop:1439 length:1167 start_codon:yes stop_codon:yes gene_type:complete
MAYQNVATPRFYINAVEFMQRIGMNVVINMDDEPLGITGIGGVLPYTTIPKKFDTFWQHKALAIDPNYNHLFRMIIPHQAFIAVLGHNIKNSDESYDFAIMGPSSYYPFSSGTLINAEPFGTTTSTTTYKTIHQGFSIFRQASLDIEPNSFWSASNNMLNYFSVYGDWNSPSHYVGTIVMGTYYDMKNAPDLSLSMSREYGGTKEFTSINGSTLSNTMWNKPSMWGKAGAWELYEGRVSEEATGNTIIPKNDFQGLSRTGRRTWDLSFSYMDDGDLWGPNQSLSETLYTGLGWGDHAGYEQSDLFGGALEGDDMNAIRFVDNILTDDNFFSQVWHKTLGGTIPFIFQPDKNNDNPDQFATCIFKDNSLVAERTSFNTYNISLKIEEVW